MTDWDETEALGESTEDLCERCCGPDADPDDGLCQECADNNDGRVVL